MAKCKVPGQRTWRNRFSDKASDADINDWLNHVSLKHPKYLRYRQGAEWCLIRGLVTREARKRGLL
jgi:hypothetical protein